MLLSFLTPSQLLETFLVPHPHSPITFVNICRDIVCNFAYTITICWVPSHIELQDHDHADFLAKKATRKPNINHTFPLNLDEAKLLSKQNLTLKWEKQVPIYPTGRTYHNLFPQGCVNKPLSPRRKDTCIARLRLHSCSLNSYLLKIGLQPTGLCDVCSVPESVDHFLLHCSKHKSLAQEIVFAAKRSSREPLLSTLLSTEPFQEILYRYISSNNIMI
jgi:hypothetical protein